MIRWTLDAEEAEGRPLARAMAAAIAAPAAIFASIVMVLVPDDLAGRAQEALVAFGMASTVAALLAIFLGLPAYLLLRSANLLSATAAIATGFCIGFAPVAMLSAFAPDGLLDPSLLIAGGFGAVSGAAFWVVHARV